MGRGEHPSRTSRDKGQRTERELAMKHAVICPWCGGRFEPRRTGGRAQRFCCAGHRRAFDRAARWYVLQALDAGTLTAAELEDALGPHGQSEQPLMLRVP